MDVWQDLKTECFHFWGVVENITFYPYSETTYGCSAAFLYGTTPPMIDQSRSIYLSNNITSQCERLKAVTIGDVVEVWASIAASDMGFGLWFKDIEVHLAE